MEKRLNKGLSIASPTYGRPTHAMSFLSGLLAFVLSAVMAIGFIALVNKTHDLLSPAQFEEQVVVRR
jgi:hypothetical protein